MMDIQKGVKLFAGYPHDYHTFTIFNHLNKIKRKKLLPLLATLFCKAVTASNSPVKDERLVGSLLIVCTFLKSKR